MNLLIKGAAKRLLLSLLAASSLAGCAVYGPPYSGYDGYYDTYGPAYVGPPVTVDLGFVYDHRSYRHGGRHYRGHDFRGHRHGHPQRAYRGRGRR